MTIEETSRGQIRAFLPDALANAIRSYDTHMRAVDQAELAKHHAAGKAALAHIELLLKLARWADGPEGGRKDAVLAALMSEAEEELAAYEAQNFDSGEEKA